MERHVDVVVVGSGAGGMTAAITAGLEGRSVLVVEATPYFGGTSAISGGAIWVPNNPFMRSIGLNDSVEDARTYMSTLAGDSLPTDRRDAFLAFGPRMLQELHDRTAWLRWEPSPYGDYVPEAPGSNRGRTLAPQLIDARVLGTLRRSLRPPSPAMDVRPLVVTAADLGALRMGVRTAAGRRAAVRVGLRAARSFVTRRELLAIGQALCARLRLALRDLEIPLWVSTPMVDLIDEPSDGQSVVKGVRVRRDGEEISVYAHGGVILASGGFSRNQEMRSKYLPGPTDAEWTLTPEDGQDGDGINAGTSVGGSTALMDRAWGMPTVVAAVGGRNAPLLTQSERSLPGVMVVDRTGGRYADETLPYEDFWRVMYARERENGAAVPSWLIFDQRVKNRYLFLRTPPGLPFPRSYKRTGVVHAAPTIEALADKIAVPVDALTATTQRYNRYARTGHDLEFGRGDSALAKLMGDPTLEHPNMAPIEHAPFYAVPLFPGDIGTKGGLVTDHRGRVLREDGSIVQGLYATGNCAAAPATGDSYPGAGATIGAAMVFGYIAAKDIIGSD